jgi:hypothetical protein
LRKKERGRKYIQETRKMAGISQKCKVFEMSLVPFSKIVHPQTIYILFDMLDLFWGSFFYRLSNEL